MLCSSLHLIDAGLEGLMSKAIFEVMKELPDDPLRFLIDHLTTQHLQQQQMQTPESPVWNETAVS